MTIVDTTVWIDYLNRADTPQSNWLDAAISREQVGLTDHILCELLQGYLRESEFTAVRREMRDFFVFNSGGEAIAIAAAINYRFLRSQGSTVRKTADCIIATFCIENGHSLLHRDRDFDAFEKHLGLRVIHPKARPFP